MRRLALALLLAPVGALLQPAEAAPRRWCPGHGAAVHSRVCVAWNKGAPGTFAGTCARYENLQTCPSTPIH